MTRAEFWIQVEASWSKDCDIDFAEDDEILKDACDQDHLDKMMDFSLDV